MKPDGQRREAGHFTIDGISRHGGALRGDTNAPFRFSVDGRDEHAGRNTRLDQGSPDDRSRRLEIFMLAHALSEADGAIGPKPPNVSPSISTVPSGGRTHFVANPDSSY